MIYSQNVFHRDLSTQDTQYEAPQISMAIASDMPDPPHDQPAVRFASVNQEIEPSHSLQMVQTSVEESRETPAEHVAPEAKEQLQSLAIKLHKSRLQERRLHNFSFEPVSLPVSRVGSGNAGMMLICFL
jgi:hypothetical protein